MSYTERNVVRITQTQKLFHAHLAEGTGVLSSPGRNALLSATSLLLASSILVPLRQITASIVPFK